MQAVFKPGAGYGIALSLGLMMALPAQADEEMVLMVDAPDLFKIKSELAEPKFKDVLGKKIYSNSGKEIGEIDDFMMAGSGVVYAVLDTSRGPIKELTNMLDDEMIIVPLMELRRAPLPTSNP